MSCKFVYEEISFMSDKPLVIMLIKNFLQVLVYVLIFLNLCIYTSFFKGFYNRYCSDNSNIFSYDITLEFSEAIFGAEKEFELFHLETCEVCLGTGAKVGSKMRICSTCGGRGQVMRTEQTPFGLFSQVIGNFLVQLALGRLFSWGLGGTRHFMIISHHGRGCYEEVRFFMIISHHGIFYILSV